MDIGPADRRHYHASTRVSLHAGPEKIRHLAHRVSMDGDRAAAASQAGPIVMCGNFAVSQLGHVGLQQVEDMCRTLAGQLAIVLGEMGRAGEGE